MVSFLNIVRMVEVRKKLEEAKKEVKELREKYVKNINEAFQVDFFNSEEQLINMLKNQFHLPDDKLNKVISIIKENEIDELLNNIFKRINDIVTIKENVKENIKNLILINKAPFEDKIAFLTLLNEKPILKITELLSGEEKSENFVNLFINEVNQNLAKEIGEYVLNEINYRLGQGSTGQGVGELFLVFFGGGLPSPEKGDVLLPKDEKTILTKDNYTNESVKVEVKSDNGRIYMFENKNPIKNEVSVGLPEMSRGSLETYWAYLKLDKIFGGFESVLKKFSKNVGKDAFKKLITLFQDKDNDPPLLDNVVNLEGNYYIVDKNEFKKITKQAFSSTNFIKIYHDNKVIKELQKAQALEIIPDKDIEEAKKKFLKNALHFIITARVTDTDKINEIRKEITKVGEELAQGKNFDDVFRKALTELGKRVFNIYLTKEGFDVLLYFFVKNNKIIFKSIRDGNLDNSKFLFYDLTGFFSNGNQPVALTIKVDKKKI